MLGLVNILQNATDQMYVNVNYSHKRSHSLQCLLNNRENSGNFECSLETEKRVEVVSNIENTGLFSHLVLCQFFYEKYLCVKVYRPKRVYGVISRGNQYWNV